MTATPWYDDPYEWGIADREDDRVGIAHGCPFCLERRADELVWLDDGETIECATCGATYTLD